MGVPGLNPFLRRRYPSAFPNRGDRYNSIYLDANALLYPIADTTADPEHIARLLLDVSREYHDLFSGNVLIYLDGPSHMGKIRHQRLRRWKYSPMTIRENSDGSIGLWSQAIFTPGTPQMKMINTYIRDHLHEYPMITTFSSSDEVGEGEHKIIRDIRLLPPSSDKIAIVGKDADLILLGMSIIDKDITILRHWNEEDENTYKARDDLQHINCTLLRNLIEKDMKGHSIWNFIISTFIIGNDFIPPIPECLSIFNILPRIIRERVRVYDDRSNTIDWRGMFRLLSKMRGHHIDDRWVGKVHDEKTFNTLYYSKYLPYNVNHMKMVQQWAITIEWIFTYYSRGLDIASRSWQYNMSISPTLSTIIDIGIENIVGLEVATQQVPPLLPQQALACALPPWLHILLPPKQRESISQYNYYYPYSYKMIEILDYPDIPTIPYSVASTL